MNLPSNLFLLISTSSLGIKILKCIYVCKMCNLRFNMRRGKHRRLDASYQSSINSALVSRRIYVNIFFGQNSGNNWTVAILCVT